jgi:hypothetical protein
MTGMVIRRLFFISLALFIASTLGCLGFVFLSFAFFTYHGNGMDWIYPAGGLAVFVWVTSASGTVITGAMVLLEKIQKKRNSN